MKSQNFALKINYRKPPQTKRLNRNTPSHLIVLTAPKKLKNETIQFRNDPPGNMNQRGHVPHTGKDQGIDDESHALIRQRSLSPELRAFSTAVIRGLQFSSSKLPGPRKNPKTLSLIEDHEMFTGESARPFHEPNHKPLHLSIFSLAPEPCSLREYTAKTARIVRVEVTTRVVPYPEEQQNIPPG